MYPFKKPHPPKKKECQISYGVVVVVVVVVDGGNVTAATSLRAPIFPAVPVVRLLSRAVLVVGGVVVGGGTHKDPFWSA
jgi:hypothetical protein